MSGDQGEHLPDLQVSARLQQSMSTPQTSLVSAQHQVVLQVSPSQHSKVDWQGEKNTPQLALPPDPAVPWHMPLLHLRLLKQQSLSLWQPSPVSEQQSPSTQLPGEQHCAVFWQSSHMGVHAGPPPAPAAPPPPLPPVAVGLQLPP